MRRSAIVSMAAITLAALAALALLQPASGQTPVSGGHFRRALSADPGNLDPALTNTSEAIAVKMVVFDSLLRQTPPSLAIAPGAAESWSVSADGKILTFHLRRGIRFHHGREMTAEDVKYSIERILTPEMGSPFIHTYDRIVGAPAFIAKQAREVSGIQVLDRFTLQIHNSVVDSTFPLVFTLLFIVPKDEAERLGREFGQRPVGSGPFIFVSWNRDDSLLLKENATYWDGRPYISALEFRIIPDPATRQAEFDTGRLDFMLLEDPTYRRYADDPQWKPNVVEVAELFTRHMGLNTTKPPLNDVRVRQAINYAIDKATTVRTVLQNKAFVATGVFPPSLDAYDPTLRGYEYNPQRARDLLTQAGLSNGFEMDLNGSSTPVAGRWLEALQRYLADVGVRAHLIQQDFGVMLERASKGDLMTYVLSTGGGSNCVNYLGPFRSRNFGIAGNRMFYKNERVDALIDEAERTFESRQQIRLCREAERLIVADAPWFFWNYNKAALVHQPTVHGIVGNPLEMDWIQMQKIWFQPRR
jgi:peptide/nickel transport system substrate-binding protein